MVRRAARPLRRCCCSPVPFPPPGGLTERIGCTRERSRQREGRASPQAKQARLVLKSDDVLFRVSSTSVANRKAVHRALSPRALPGQKLRIQVPRVSCPRSAGSSDCPGIHSPTSGKPRIPWHADLSLACLSLHTGSCEELCNGRRKPTGSQVTKLLHLARSLRPSLWQLRSFFGCETYVCLTHRLVPGRWSQGGPPEPPQSRRTTGAAASCQGRRYTTSTRIASSSRQRARSMPRTLSACASLSTWRTL